MHALSASVCTCGLDIVHACRIILFGILICYIAAAVIEFRVYTFNDTGTTFNVWPSWGWIVAIIAAVLWFLAAVCASCAPLTPIFLLPVLQAPCMAYVCSHACRHGP